MEVFHGEGFGQVGFPVGAPDCLGADLEEDLIFAMGVEGGEGEWVAGGVVDEGWEG